MNRIKKYTLTIIPLIITTILIFYGYISAYNSFFYKYSNLIINSNSDYGIFLSGNTILQEEALDSSSLLRKANLEKMSFIGFLNMNLFFKEKMFSNVTIFFASNSYFSLYTSLSPVTGDFFLSSNFKDKLDLELNKEIDIRFQSGTEFNKSTSFDLNNYIKIDNIFESLEFLTDELTLNNFNEYFCLFLASDLDNFFAEDASLFDINTLVLFEFKESWLEKQSPKEIKEKLYEQQKIIDTYFHYSFNIKNYNKIELILYRNSLIVKIRDLEEVRNYFLSRTMLRFYFVLFFFSYFLIKYSQKSFFDLEKTKYRYFLLRGGKRYNLSKVFIKQEIKNMLISFIFIYPVCVLIYALKVNFARILSYFYIMILSFSSRVLIVVALTQLFIALQLKEKLVLEGDKIKELKKNEKSNLIGVFKSIAKIIIFTVFIRSISFIISSIFFYDSFKDNNFKLILLIFLFYILFIVIIILISKNSFFVIFQTIFSRIKNFSKIMQYSYKHTLASVKRNLGLAKLILVFGLTISFIFIVSDSLNEYSLTVHEKSKIGDFIISYSVNESIEIQNRVNDLSQKSIEIFLGSALIPVKTDPFTNSYCLMKIFLINESKINLFFSSNEVIKNYMGTMNPRNLSLILQDHNSSVVISKSFSSIVPANKNDYVSIPVENSPNSYYNASVVEVCNFIPFVSVMSYNNFYLIASSKFEDINLKNLSIDEIYQIIWLKDGISEQTFISTIEGLNDDLFSVNQIQTFSISLFDNSFFLNENELKNFTFSSLVIMSLYQFIFLFLYFNQLIKSQIKTFKIFISRGLKAKKGLYLAVLPLLLLTAIFLILGYLFGIMFSFLILKRYQPEYFIPIKVIFYKNALFSLFIYFGAVLLILLVSSLFSYYRFKNEIKPEIDNLNFLFDDIEW